MFSYETEHIIRKVQNKLSAGRGSITLRAILSAPIHNAVKVYFRASISGKYGQMENRHGRDSVNIRKLQSEIDLLLPSDYTFTGDNFVSLLTDAVNFQFNYLCRPRWTMKEFFFHDTPSLTVPEMKHRFLYFSAYEYYPSVLFRYLRQKGIDEVDRDLFDSMILKIDKLALGDASPYDYAELLKPFASFIAYGREDGDDSIPEHALALFFADKNFINIRNYLESTLKRQKIAQVKIEEIRDLLALMPQTVRDITDGEAAVKPEPVPQPPPETEPESPAYTEPEISVEDEREIKIEKPVKPDEPEEPVEHKKPPKTSEDIFERILRERRKPEGKKDKDEKREINETKDKSEPDEVFQPLTPAEEEIVFDEETIDKETISEEYNSNEEPTAEYTLNDDESLIEEEPYEDESVTEDEALENDDAGIDDEPIEEEIPDNRDILQDFADESHEIEKIEEKPADSEEEQVQKMTSSLPSLDMLIEDDERKRFVRKLFNGDTAYFNVVIETLNKMTSWKEASLYIDEIFLMNGVDPYSSDSVNFTDKVYTRFSHKSKFK